MNRFLMIAATAFILTFPTPSFGGMDNKAIQFYSEREHELVCKGYMLVNVNNQTQAFNKIDVSDQKYYAKYDENEFKVLYILSAVYPSIKGASAAIGGYYAVVTETGDDNRILLIEAAKAKLFQKTQ